jgi:glycosyltransferase involved in cell wall biosynthesis
MHAAVLLLNRGRGSGGVARQHARALLAAGHRVTFIHPRVGEGVAGAENVDVALHTDVVPVHEYLPAAGSRQQAVSTMTPMQSLRYTADIAAALSSLEDVDVVMAHHANLTAVAARYYAQRMRIPYVVFVHGTGIEPRHYGGYDDAVWGEIQAALEAAAGIIVTTDYVRDQLVRPVAEIPVGRFFVLPCGVDLDEFDPELGAGVCERFDLPDPYVISPGAVTQAKGAPNVVEASRVYADLAPTIFIGDGDLRPSLETELADRGRFLGYVTDAEKAALINGATILTAAPDKQEHFGIIYVVSHDVGITTERSPFALGAAIRQLLIDDGRRRRMARAGRDRAERLYDEATLGDEFVSWLEAVARRDSGWQKAGHPVFGEVAG